MSITKADFTREDITKSIFSPKKHIRNLRINKIIKIILKLAGFSSIIIVFAQIVFLGKEAFPALKYLDLLGREWVPVSSIDEKFGLLPLITGSLIVTVASMLIAIPVGVGIAIFIAEIVPHKLKATLKGIVEILAGIPSVVYGFWGMKVLTVFLGDTFSRDEGGHSALAGAIVLAIMALPTIVSISEDALSVVPNEYREASLGLGANKWQTISQIVVPSASSGIVTAAILGMGRAIGETMAVVMVTGNSSLIPSPITDLWSRVRTITANVAIEMPETPYNTTHYHMLFLMVLLLFVIIIVINVVSEIVLLRIKEKFQPKNKLNSKIIIKPQLTLSNKAGIKKYIQNIGLLIKYALMMIKYLFHKTTQKLSQFISKYKSLLSALFYQILGYVILQTWMRWSLALVIMLVFSYAIKRFSLFKPKLKQSITFILLFVNFLIVFAVLIMILYYIITNGIPAIFPVVDGKIIFNWHFFTDVPENGLRGGGIAPAILGTLYLLLGSVVLAVPIGILAGIYLAEYAKDGRFTRIIRIAIDNLNGTPSIVFGMFGMIIFCILPQLNKSLWAGQATLAMMILPTIIRTSEEAVKSVNQTTKEGSLALGATKWYTIRRIVIPVASPGIITGVILGMGRSGGETAPIMFTAVTGYSASLPTRLSSPVMALSYHLYYLSTSQPNSQVVAGGTALVLLVLVLILYGLAMAIRSSIVEKNKTSFFY